jgi:hypothetical protein
VRAPVAGSIQGLTGLSPGAWLTAGQSIGAVSPADTLIVETFVSSKDVGLLKPGQSAHLQIDAYPYTQWGCLTPRSPPSRPIPTPLRQWAPLQVSKLRSAPPRTPYIFRTVSGAQCGKA